MKRMVLTVIFQNDFQARTELLSWGVAGPLYYRIVHIELTEDQLKQLEPREVGITYNSGKEVHMYEDIKETFLEEK